MAKRKKAWLMSEDEYLKAEEKSSVRHEFVDGHVFAMVGASKAHNKIAINILVLMRQRLGGGPCDIFMSDMKLRIQSLKSYYYPDLIVSCEPFEAKSACVQQPIILVEVLSSGTKEIDHREKLIAYKKIPSLQEYVIVHQDRQKIELFRRSGDAWDAISFTPPGEELILESMPGGPLTVPFSLVYEGYNPPSRVKETEAEYEVESDFHPYVPVFT